VDWAGVKKRNERRRRPAWEKNREIDRGWEMSRLNMEDRETKGGNKCVWRT